MSSSQFPSAGQMNQLEHSEENHAKKVNNYVWNGSAWIRYQPSASGGSAAKASDEYGIQAISNDGTYKYYFFEADDADYYVMRKHIANKVFSYTKGTGGYSSVYQSPTLGPSGSPTWADRGSTF